MPTHSDPPFSRCGLVCKNHGAICGVDHRPRKVPGFRLNYTDHGHVIQDGHGMAGCKGPFSPEGGAP